MIKTRSWCLLAVIIFGSCSTSKLLTSNVRPTDITAIPKIETLSYISLIERANQGRYNDTLSNSAKELFGRVLDSFGSRIPLKGEIPVIDPVVRTKMEKEIEFLCISADRQRSISSLKLTPILDSLLEINQQRFGLITVTAGFTRVGGNYGKQIAKGIGLGILTLGMVYTTPVKANSTVYAMIIDSKNDNIAFFRKSALQDKDPLNEVVLKKQVYDIFNGYFWTDSQ